MVARVDKFEHKAAVTGLGMSQIGRRLMRDPLALTIDATLAALADAGLDRVDDRLELTQTRRRAAQAVAAHDLVDQRRGVAGQQAARSVQAAQREPLTEAERGSDAHA